jgi:hypothetical protein
MLRWFGGIAGCPGDWPCPRGIERLSAIIISSYAALAVLLFIL